MIRTSSSRCAFAASFILLGAAACASEHVDLFTSTPGNATFALAGVDDGVTSLEYAVSDNAGATVQSASLNAEADAAIRFTLDLPVARGYSISLTAQTVGGQTCTGTSTFDVVPRAIVEVAVRLECSGGSGQASVTGTLVSCPSVAIAAQPATLDVGASVVLVTRSNATLAVAPTWTATAGDLQSADGITRFTCTEPGTVEIALRLDDDECGASDSVVVTCKEPTPVSACDGLGSTCHVIDETSSAAHECHELGHGGDEAACAEGRAACIQTCGSALCTELASLCHDVDPGSGPLHECHELGHAADAAACFARGRECFDLCTRAHDEPVVIQFAAQVGAAPFACGTSYDDVGSSTVSAEPLDFRFFVHDVRLITADGSEVPARIDDRAPWQALGTALLDFEDGTGACLSGDAATNTQLTALAPPGEYTGVAFRVGVPENVNHGDPAIAPAPLAAGNMAWSWLSGYRFLRAELGSAAGGAVVHLGSTACSGDPTLGSVSCTRSNRASVTLTSFDPASDTIIADIGALFATTDLAEAMTCHSTGTSCEAPFATLGVDLATGASPASGTVQNVFRVAQ